LRFPPSKDRPDEPDFHAKPVFILQAWNGGEGNNARYETYDLMHVEDDEWEQ
jgi:mRNA guanylyltransferase